MAAGVKMAAEVRHKLGSGGEAVEGKIAADVRQRR